ncbi:MAG: BREX-1 system adenine-specific DNA-methyltransferase PglX, partial [Deltaproteobacteria bacterium]|nr:BREX-1 system adenine-specific DNA-methyltransferase PglX [Deltaproteobacteria bacterium]
MKPQTISAIHDFSLEARGIMEKEVSEQLEGLYGLLTDGKWVPAKNYPAIEKLPEARETRNRLEQFLEDERAADLNPKEARGKIIKEAAFTWLNRLVALKMMETRKLLRQTISKGTQSNGFRLWLTDPGNEKEYDRNEQGDLPHNPIGEGPRQVAYRHFIFYQCGELAKEIRVLFDPENLVTRLFPRPRALSKLIESMNDERLEEAWAPGNEETIGWIYQFFNEREKKEVFDSLYKKKQKIRREDIPAATELFTPNWIVTWLVQNSLGRYWMQMHPDSNLAEKLDYLVPLAGEIPTIPLKKAEEIKFLDPACGTMHFGLVAFDLFVEMYREEREKAGRQSWPAEPSVLKDEDIPAVIIANNIHGIDIDLRAVQLSAMTLFLKAKSLNKNTKITESHLACADVTHFDESKLVTFLGELKLTDSIYERILKGIWGELGNLAGAGSLLRFEEKLNALVAEEKKKFKKEQKIPDLAGFSPEQFETEAGEAEFWEIIEAQIVQALHFFAKSQAEKGRDESFFAGEVVKGFEVLDIMTRRFDIVATNPPYMARRSMSPNLADFLSDQYPNTKGDLYAAFIERCAEFMEENGRLAMITQQSFIFTSSYEKMRISLLNEQAIETMCHVGPRAFESISGEKVNTTLFAVRKEHDRVRKEAIGVYFRLVKEPGEDSKRRRFEAALARLRARETDNLIFYYRQADFDAIPGSPWVYWITPGLRALFEDLPSVADVAEPRVGLQTSDNSRFLRYWWEVGLKNIELDCHHVGKAKLSGKKWFPHMKGGSFRRWYGNQEYVVNWNNDGEEIDACRPAAVIRNKGFYFHEGITFNRISSKGFSARYCPPGFVFDVNGPVAFNENPFLLGGVLNSKAFSWFLSIVAATITFQVGDVSNAPIPLSHTQKTSSEDFVEAEVKKCIRLTKNLMNTVETNYDFITPFDFKTGDHDFAECLQKLNEIEKQIDEAIYRLYGFSEEDRQAVESDHAEATIVGYDDSSDGDCSAQEPLDNEIALALSKKELAYQWISYVVGIIMGRFEPGVVNGLGRGNFTNDVVAKLRALADLDGILVMDEGHTNDLPAKVLQSLNVIAGEDGAAEIVKATIEKEGSHEDLLRQYLDRQFFKLHIQQYRKRPVYWFLQSPKKKYGIWIFH